MIANFGWITILCFLVGFCCDFPSKLMSLNDTKNCTTEVQAGIYRIDELLKIIQHKKVGLVVNHSSRIGNIHLVDTLQKSGVNIQFIFAPEHGFRGNEDAGKHISSNIDSSTQIQVKSLYGKNYKPNKSDITQLDILVFDIQDVGVRFYTYISTLHYVLEACAENKIPAIVLDRPNPNGHYIDGPVLDTSFSSFVGLHPIPVVYGMTIAELAGMMKGECWINDCDQLQLTTIRCKEYDRRKMYDLNVEPSPNLKELKAILLYPSLCFFEGTQISVGRGTDYPFMIYGHPSFKSDFKFTPGSKAGASNPPWKNVLCYGYDLRKLPITELHKKKQIEIKYILKAYRELGNQDSFF
ncbi:MAG: DUF1343 domain-containing protein [Saprospiraceae bacterium]|nr:DUF1343 domain-containing protein [Saprospiraceae bacterium]